MGVVLRVSESVLQEYDSESPPPAEEALREIRCPFLPESRRTLLPCRYTQQSNRRMIVWKRSTGGCLRFDHPPRPRPAVAENSSSL